MHFPRGLGLFGGVHPEASQPSNGRMYRALRQGRQWISLQRRRYDVPDDARRQGKHVRSAHAGSWGQPRRKLAQAQSTWRFVCTMCCVHSYCWHIEIYCRANATACMYRCLLCENIFIYIYMFICKCMRVDVLLCICLHSFLNTYIAIIVVWLTIDVYGYICYVCLNVGTHACVNVCSLDLHTCW